MPHTDQSKVSVLEHFDLADQKHPTIDKAPIARWSYLHCFVYFKYDHVVDAVRHHQPRQEVRA